MGEASKPIVTCSWEQTLNMNPVHKLSLLGICRFVFGLQVPEFHIQQSPWTLYSKHRSAHLYLSQNDWEAIFFHDIRNPEDAQWLAHI